MTAQDREVEGAEVATAVVPGQGRQVPQGDSPRPGDRDPAGLPGPRRAAPWAEARAVADRAGSARFAELPPSRPVPLAQALGRTLAEPLTALTDLPSFDTSAMDGWAVSGPGPWQATAAAGAGNTPESVGILAGRAETRVLPDGSAVRIATGARIPPGATAVIRNEHARTDAGGRVHPERGVMPGQDIRPRGQECRSGDLLLPAGLPVTPAVLGLAAAAGYDALPVAPRPQVEVLVLGDELLTEGLPRDGLIRDALGPMIGPWLAALGAEVIGTRWIGDDIDALYRAVGDSSAAVLVTTGGTAAGPVDHVHPVLRKAGAELLVDGVGVRPGHPMLLARLPSERFVVGLPGNPLAAVSGLLTLAEPLLRALTGRSAGAAVMAPVRRDVHGHPQDTRLVPVVRGEDGLLPLHFHGPAMLRGIAAADGLAVVPPGGAGSGRQLEVLGLPWSSTGGGCFT